VSLSLSLSLYTSSEEALRLWRRQQIQSCDTQTMKGPLKQPDALKRVPLSLCPADLAHASRLEHEAYLYFYHTGIDQQLYHRIMHIPLIIIVCFSAPGGVMCGTVYYSCHKNQVFLHLGIASIRLNWSGKQYELESHTNRL
jgi:hypothetical protein